jgi:hypothetical protein
VFAGVRPGQALADSARLTRGRLARIVVPLLLWWLLITAAAIAIVWVSPACLRTQVSRGRSLDIRRVLPLVACTSSRH